MPIAFQENISCFFFFSLQKCCVCLHMIASNCFFNTVILTIYKSWSIKQQKSGLQNDQGYFLLSHQVAQKVFFSRIELLKWKKNNNAEVHTFWSSYCVPHYSKSLWKDRYGIMLPSSATEKLLRSALEAVNIAYGAQRCYLFRIIRKWTPFVWHIAAVLFFNCWLSLRKPWSLHVHCQKQITECTFSVLVGHDYIYFCINLFILLLELIILEWKLFCLSSLLMPENIRK